MNTNLHPTIEELSSTIDDLTTALDPIASNALSSTASKLPLLDKAKLYVLATYALESILFSYLRLHGQDAKTHPVFQELTRVKAYFAKIESAETAGAGAGRKLDKDAARRFVKHGLAGSEKYDRERAERQVQERGGAKRRLENIGVGTHTRFDGAAKRIKASEDYRSVPVVSAADADADEDGDDNEEEAGGQNVNDEASSDGAPKLETRTVGMPEKRTIAQEQLTAQVSDHASSELSRAKGKEEKRLRRQAKRERRKAKTGDETVASDTRCLTLPSDQISKREDHLGVNDDGTPEETDEERGGTKTPTPHARVDANHTESSLDRP